MLAIIPYKRIFGWLKEWQKRLPLAIGCVLLLSLAPLWWAYSSFVVTAIYGGEAQGTGAVKLASWSDFFQGFGLQPILKSYFADNYTFVGLLFCFIGFVLFLWMRKRLPADARRFMLAFIGSAILMFLMIPESITGHSYHQFPAFPIILLLIAYCFTVISVTVHRYVKFPFVKGVVIALLFFVPIPVFSYAIENLGSHTLYFSSMQAAARQWDTQFYGLDIAGDYVKAHKQPGDRIMHSGFQAFGILWHGDIKGTRGIPGNITWVHYAEDRLNATWLFVYNWDFNLFQDASRWDYLGSHYRLVQVAFTQQGNQPQLLYLLMRKGGNFSLDQINSLVSGKPVQTRQYETTRGNVPVQYVNIEK